MPVGWPEISACVHLDSYGLQRGWKNHNPAHPGGRDPESFKGGAVELVRRVRDEMRKHVPDAVVILKGAEHTELLDVCDGAQIKSLAVIHRKPRAAQGWYPVFTSSFSLAEMERILAQGHNLAIAPWWLTARPGRRDENILLVQTNKRSRFDQIEALHRYHNILLVNGRLSQPVADCDGISQGILEQLNHNGWTSRFIHPPLVEAAQRYTVAYSRDEGRLTREPADLIREMLLAEASRPVATSRPGYGLQPLTTRSATTSPLAEAVCVPSSCRAWLPRGS
ncbi:MAG: hypothetical protein ACUVXJ_09320 [Phycisphaerae bacterium]